MPQLRLRPSGPNRKISVTPATAGWTYVGFEVGDMKSGAERRGESADRETCLVLISGKARLAAGETDFGLIGKRMSPFEGRPHALYVPAGLLWRVTAETALTLAVCTAPGRPGSHPPRLIGPDDVTQETRVAEPIPGM